MDIFCDYCSVKIERYIPPCMLSRNKHFFCSREHSHRYQLGRRYKLREPLANASQLQNKEQLRCKECGFRDGNGEYSVGDTCPKCGLSNLVKEKTSELV